MNRKFNLVSAPNSRPFLDQTANPPSLAHRVDAAARAESNTALFPRRHQPFFRAPTPSHEVVKPWLLSPCPPLPLASAPTSRTPSVSACRCVHAPESPAFRAKRFIHSRECATPDLPPRKTRRLTPHASPKPQAPKVNAVVPRQALQTEAMVKVRPRASRHRPGAFSARDVESKP